jgi:transposase-like protein
MKEINPMGDKKSNRTDEWSLMHPNDRLERLHGLRDRISSLEQSGVWPAEEHRHISAANRLSIGSPPMGRDERQAIAAAALVAGATQQQAADEANVSESTIKRWLREPSFAADMRSRVPDVVELQAAARRRLAEQLDRNIEALIEIRDDPKAAPAMRERAARTLLDRSALDLPRSLALGEMTIAAAVDVINAEIQRLEQIQGTAGPQ